MPDAFPTRISFQQARTILSRIAGAHRMPVEETSLSRALGCVLATDVKATTNLPGFDNSAMDGFALVAADLASEGPTDLELVAEQFAGAASRIRASAGQCIRVTTGAPLPPGCDAVVIKEHTSTEGTRVRVAGPVVPGANVRYAGEDVRKGETVLRAGTVLAPAALSLLAALGLPVVPIHRRPTVALFTTGDEIRPPGVPLEAGQIYDSNRVLLQTLLAYDGFEPVAWPVLPDEPDRIRAALLDAAFSFDVVITCGGVSAGEKDFLPAILAELGEVHFWKVRMKPGMPFLAGGLGSAHLFCLPGNPVSVLATHVTLVRGFLDGLQGRREPRATLRARLSAPVSKGHDRLEFLRGSLSCDDQGQLIVVANPADGSHRLRAAADSNALIVLPEGGRDWAAGSVMEVLALDVF